MAPVLATPSVVPALLVELNPSEAEILKLLAVAVVVRVYDVKLLVKVPVTFISLWLTESNGKSSADNEYVNGPVQGVVR